MKVLHINANFISTKLHSLLVNELNVHCDNVVYAPSRRSQPRIVYDSCPNVIEAECTTDVDRLFFRYKSQKLYKNINSLIDVSQFDIIHAHTLFTDGYVAYKLSKEFGKKYIVAVRNTDVNVFFKYMVHLRHIGLEILRNASKVVFLSNTYKKRVFEKYIPTKYHKELLSKAVVIPNGIDQFWLENICKTLHKPIDNQIRVAFVGTLDKNKNVETVIDSLLLLRSRGYDVSLDVAGRMSYDTVLKKVESCEFAKYHGCIPKEKLIEIYRTNDVFILPSYKETFGLVYVEAMSQGLPVLYTKDEGFDGQFDDGVVGYSVSADSAKEIADAACRIIGDYQAISSRCTASVLDFDWKIIANKYNVIYKEICSVF